MYENLLLRQRNFIRQADKMASKHVDTHTPILTHTGHTHIHTEIDTEEAVPKNTPLSLAQN